MSQLEVTQALARLLSEPQLRRAFEEDPDRAARELNADSATHGMLAQLDIAAIEEQAQTLLTKRQSEVARILPKTWSRLGRRAKQHFMRYANQSPWPTGHRRHLADAAAFCRHLHELQQPVLRTEWNRTRFLAKRRRFALHVVRESSAKRRLGWKLQLLYRIGAAARERTVSF